MCDSDQFAAAIKENGWPSQLTASLIGSCTNSSYEDMTRSASIVRQALEAGIKVCSMHKALTPVPRHHGACVSRAVDDGLLAHIEAQ